MGDALAAFQQLLGKSQEDAGPGACEVVLSQLEPLTAECVRRGAIPHHIDKRVLETLVPETPNDEIDRIYEKLATLSLVALRRDSLAIHDAVRTYLFRQWLTSYSGTFKAISSRLTELFAAEAETLIGQERDRLCRHAMFHLIGADQSRGMAEFEKLVRRYRRVGVLENCGAVIKLVHEYDPGLTAASSAILAYHEGKLESDRRNWDPAQTLFTKVIHTEEADERLRMKALNRLGLVQIEMRQWTQATECFDAALQIAKRGDYPELGLIYDDLAVAFKGLRQRERAEEFVHESIKVATRKQDRLCLATAYNTQGTLLASFHEVKEAIAAYLKALDNLDDAHRLLRAQIYNNIGGLYADLAEWAQSEKYFEMSLAISKEGADTIGQARTLANMIRVHRSAGRIDEAISAGDRAIAYFETLHDDVGAGNAALSLAKLFRALNRVDDALQRCDQAAKFFSRAGASRELAIAETERRSLVRTPGIPWWAWVSAVVAILGVVAMIIILVVVVAEKK